MAILRVSIFLPPESQPTLLKVLSSLAQNINTTKSFTLISDSGFLHILPTPGSEK